MKRLILFLAVLVLVAVPANAYSTMHFNSSLVDLGGHSWTNVNSTPYSTTTKILGSASIQFTKTSYRSVTTPTYPDFNFTDDDFTVDFFFNPGTGGATANGGGVVTLSSGTVRSPLLILETASELLAYSSSDGVNWDILNGASVGTLSASTWSHHAVVRHGNTFSMYKDGVLVSTITSSATLMNSSTVAWGRRGWDGGDNFITGFVDEGRITSGARWVGPFTPPTTEENYTYIYSNPGTFTFTCPAGFTNGTVTLIGGGGSGKGGSAGMYAGGGGYAGERKTYAKVATTPGTAYTITVATGGANSSYGLDSNAGGASTAFTKSASGGLGGITLPTGVYNGGDGATGFLSTGRISLNGTNASGFVWGNGGTGWGAGGGGGSYDAVAPLDTMGGYGASGYVSIANYADYTGNIPEFSADDTEIPYGTIVRFTDQSTITDSSGLTYNWSFGDGEYSNTVGDVQHVYAYMGSFDVSLTISAASGEIVETKSSYIQVTTQPSTDLNIKTEPVSVRLHVQSSVTGNALPDANVSILCLSTSSGNWDWIETLYGIPVSSVAINGTTMYQTTDSLGNTEFVMIPSAKYQVIVNYSAHVYATQYVTPSANRYTVAINTASPWDISMFEPGVSPITPTSRTVILTCVNSIGNPISGVVVSATPQNFSAPANWAEQYYGFSGVNFSGTTMTGITGADGSWAAPMMSSYLYNFSFTKSGMTPYSMMFYPSANSYLIRLPSVTTTTPSNEVVTYSLWNVTANSTHESFRATYQDTSGQTQWVVFWVKNSTGSLVYNTSDMSIGTGVNSFNSGNLSHVAGDMYSYGFYANRSPQWVNGTSFLKWPGTSSLADFPAWVSQYISIALLILFAAGFGAYSVKYAIIGTPILAYFFFFIGWLDPVSSDTAFLASVGVLLVLGVLFYIRKQEATL